MTTAHPKLRFARAFLTAWLLLGLPTCLHAATGSTVIRDVAIVDPQSGTIRQGFDVSIADGRIAMIGPDLPIVAEQEVINATGLYLIPGLIDSHVHLYHASGLNRRYTERFESLYDAYLDQAPRSYLYYGYTSVIELNADFDTNARYEAAPLGPNIYHCAQGVVLPNGFMSLEIEGALADSFPNFLYDGYADETVASAADAAEHTPEAVVAEVAANGGRCIKIYYEEALWWPGGAPPFALPSEAIVRDLVAAAHRRGMPVLLHATTPRGFRFGLDTGIDIFAHGPWEWPDVPFTYPLPTPEIEALISDPRFQQIFVQPTARTLGNTASLFSWTSAQRSQARNVLPASFIDYLDGVVDRQRSAFLGMFGSSFRSLLGLADDQPIPNDSMAVIQQEHGERYSRLIGRMRSAGVPFLFGTDTVVGGFGWGNPPGLNGYWEMQEWHRAGVPLEQILRAATIDNATTFGLGDELGTVEPGKRADLLLVRENPLQTINAYDSIEIVIVGGSVVDRASLSARAAREAE